MPVQQRHPCELGTEALTDVPTIIPFILCIIHYQLRLRLQDSQSCLRHTTRLINSLVFFNRSLPLVLPQRSVNRLRLTHLPVPESTVYEMKPSEKNVYVKPRLLNSSHSLYASSRVHGARVGISKHSIGITSGMHDGIELLSLLACSHEQAIDKRERLDWCQQRFKGRP